MNVPVKKRLVDYVKRRDLPIRTTVLWDEHCRADAIDVEEVLRRLDPTHPVVDVVQYAHAVKGHEAALSQHLQPVFLVLDAPQRYVIIDASIDTKLLLLFIVYNDDLVLLLVRLCLELGGLRPKGLGLKAHFPFIVLLRHVSALLVVLFAALDLLRDVARQLVHVH